MDLKFVILFFTLPLIVAGIVSCWRVERRLTQFFDWIDRRAQDRSRRQAPMTFERLMDRAFGGGGNFWTGGPRGLQLEDVRLYLDEGGDANRRVDSGNTLLHIAADNGDLDVMKLLVSRGAEVNAKGYHGYTPLHLAVDLDCNTSGRDGRRATELPVTKTLLGLGADPSIRDDDGEIPRDTAVAYGVREAELFDALVCPPSRSDV